MAATATIEITATGRRECAVCRADISHRNAGAKTCGERCRQAMRRRGCTGTSPKVIKTAPKILAASSISPPLKPEMARRELWSAHADLKRLYATRGFWLEDSRLPRLSEDLREKLEAEIAAASTRARNSRACLSEHEVVE